MSIILLENFCDNSFFKWMNNKLSELVEINETKFMTLENVTLF